MTTLPRVLREPLVHFLGLGLLVFLAWGWIGEDLEESNEIVVSRGQQTRLIETFERTWGRPPTRDEFSGLIDEYLREELAYREGSLRELDRNDTVIRRRLRQKLELLAEDLATIVPPTPAEIEAGFAANAESYRSEPSYSLEQVVFSPDLRGASAEMDARDLLARLESGEPVEPEALVGDSGVLPRRLAAAGELEITATFGDAFAAQLAELPPGRWSGPVASGFGWHVVRIGERTPGEIPPLSAVAERVQTDLLVERRRAALDVLYAGLAQRYSIRVEPLAEPAESASADGE
jgi:hypothetical protein